MRVLRAETLGMCFGVRDALAVMRDIAEPRSVTVHGELVHNEVVLTELQTLGFRTMAETDRSRMADTPAVLITAHGVSDRERHRLQEAGKRLLDTTCPLVARAHRAAKTLRDEGCHVLVIGRRGHVEVQGIIEDLPSHDVIQSVDDVRRWPHERLGIVCQTTAPARLVARIRRAVSERNPHADIRFIDTVCQPTKDHQRALDRLLDQVDVMVVVGGRNSNNTKELVALCRERGVPAFHVQGADDLRPEWFATCATVGVTAGTSTLDETIGEVEAALHAMGALATVHG